MRTNYSPLNFLLVPAIFLLQFIVPYLAPAPFRQLNILYIFFTWMIIYRNKINFYWVALILSILSELFSSYPFGISTLACLISLFIAHRLFFVVFANFSWYSIFLLGFLSGLLYKIIFYLLFFSLLTIQHQTMMPLLSALYPSLYSALAGAAAILVIFLISKFFVKNSYQYSPLL